MTPKELADHKAVPKRLAGLPQFKSIKRGKLPKPLHKLGGPRLQATDLIAVSDSHSVVFIWRDGELLTDSAFFAYLFCTLGDGSLYPLFLRCIFIPVTRACTPNYLAKLCWTSHHASFQVRQNWLYLAATT